jgi:hypothetical protein
MTTVTLNYPIQAHGETVSEVTVRRARVADLKLLDQAGGDVAKTAALVGALCNLTPREVDGLDAEDFARLGAVVADFLPNGPPAGVA